MSRPPFARLAALPLAARLALFLACSAVIVWASGLQRGALGKSDPFRIYWKNLAHAPLYGAFAFSFLLCLGLRAPFRWGAWCACLAVVLGAGLLDEWHQARIGGRYSDLGDVGTDLLGATAAALFARWLSAAPLDYRRGARLFGLSAGTLLLWGYLLLETGPYPIPFLQP